MKERNMATRSLILKEEKNGKYSGLYCHCDGYLTHNGAILIDHYNTKERVEELFKRGDLSYLAPKVEPDPQTSHTHENPCADVCVFYSRDRGFSAEDTAPFTCELAELDSDPLIEYAYIFNRDGQWNYFEIGKLKDGTKPLKESVENIFKDWGFPRPVGLYGWYSKKEIELFKTRYEEYTKQKEQAEKVQEQDQAKEKSTSK